MTTLTAPPKITKDRRRLLKSLPGYDPFKTRGDCWFDADAADRVVRFFSGCLKHVKGPMAGKPFALEGWQEGVIQNLFGWMRPDGTRRYRECFLYVAKKNGKTAFSAGVLLYMLGFDGEASAEVYSAAASRDQASLVFDHAKGFVRLDARLGEMFTVYGAKGGSIVRSIVHDTSSSAYRPLAAGADKADGVSPHFNAVDELHRHPGPELADILQKSTAARSQPITLYTTTADWNRPSLCNDKLKYARHVMANKGDPSAPGFDSAFLPVIYEATAKDDWEDPKTWKKANPNLGVTVPMDFMERECRKAKDTPTELNNFLRLHLNIVTDSDVAFIPAESWESCREEFDESMLLGRECFAALDMATTRDLTALALVFPFDDGVWRLLTYFWVPADCARKRQKEDGVPYLTWIQEGNLRATPGNVTDYDTVRSDIFALAKKFRFREFAIDRWNTTQLQQQLMGEGIEVVEFGQGFRSMTAPTKELDRLVASGNLKHNGDPVLAWNAANLMVESDPAGNLKPSKRKSGEKIDGMVATIMALGRGIVVGEEAVSVYDAGGGLTIL